MHEEHENGKSCLPGPCLLYVLDPSQRQPVSRVTPWRIVSLEEHELFRRGGTAPPDVCIHPVTGRGQRDSMRAAKLAGLLGGMFLWQIRYGSRPGSQADLFMIG